MKMLYTEAVYLKVVNAGNIQWERATVSMHSVCCVASHVHLLGPCERQDPGVEGPFFVCPGPAGTFLCS